MDLRGRNLNKHCLSKTISLEWLPLDLVKNLKKSFYVIMISYVKKHMGKRANKISLVLHIIQHMPWIRNRGCPDPGDRISNQIRSKITHFKMSKVINQIYFFQKNFL